MAILTRQDILTALRIWRVWGHAFQPGVGEVEAAAYRRKAMLLADRYRYGDLMALNTPQRARLHRLRVGSDTILYREAE